VDGGIADRLISGWAVMPVLSAAALAYLNRKIVRGDAAWRRYERTQIARYRLCVEVVSPDGSPVPLGATTSRSLARSMQLPAGNWFDSGITTEFRPAARLRHVRYDVVSNGAALVDVAGQRFEVADGTPLHLRGFDDAVVRPSRSADAGSDAQEAAESSGLDVAIPAKRRFWILDTELPTSQAMFRQGKPLQLPAKPEGYELVGVGPPSASRVPSKPWRWPYVLVIASLVSSVALAPAWVQWPLVVALAIVTIVRYVRSWAIPSLPDATHAALRETADDPESYSVTMGYLDDPLWTFRLAEPTWLLPDKRSSPPSLFVFDIADAHCSDGIDPRDAPVEAASQFLRDAVATQTDLQTATMVSLIVGLRRFRITKQAVSWETLKPSMSDHPGRHAVVWGFACADLEQQGYSLRVRMTSPPGDVETTIEAPLPELAEKLIDHLVGLGVCRRAPHGAAFALPARDGLIAIASVYDGLLLQILSHRRNRALPEIGAGLHVATVQQALAVSASLPDYVPAQILPFVSAIYAHEAGHLSSETRDQLRTRALEADAAGAVGRLAPRILHGLGAKEDALAVREAQLATAEGPYRTWLGGCLKESSP